MQCILRVCTSPRFQWTIDWLSDSQGSMWLAPVFTKQSSHQVSESGDTFLHLAFLGQFTIVWWKPLICNLPISSFKIWWYHKINLSIPQRWQNSLLLVLPPCSVLNFCCSFATMNSDLWSWTNQSGSRCHMACKMAGRHGLPCYTIILPSQWCKIQRFICTFHALLSEQKNTVHVILLIILLFLLVQYDGIHFTLINHDNL